LEECVRTPFVAGNWKMNTTVQEAVNLVTDLRRTLAEIGRIEKVVFPPFVSLLAVQCVLQGSDIGLGAQNMYFEEKGAYTGEVSPLMLAGICRYVIIGHSERRQYFYETDALVSQKVRAALKHKLIPILCVGESLSEHENNQTEAVVTRQVNGSLAGVETVDQLVVAYEPVWAIGTGKAAHGRPANQTIGLIRSLVEKNYSRHAADSLRILYGGSVTPANIAEFVSEPEIDGALVGGASLKAADFTEIVKTVARIRPII
jgi:triosephosphate isomerase (TIM)